MVSMVGGSVIFKCIANGEKKKALRFAIASFVIENVITKGYLWEKKTPEIA